MKLGRPILLWAFTHGLIVAVVRLRALITGRLGRLQFVLGSDPFDAIDLVDRDSQKALRLIYDVRGIGTTDVVRCLGQPDDAHIMAQMVSVNSSTRMRGSVHTEATFLSRRASKVLRPVIAFGERLFGDRDAINAAWPQWYSREVMAGGCR